MPKDPIKDLSTAVESHRIGCYTVNFDTCEVERHLSQRAIDEDHVAELLHDYQVNIVDRGDHLVAIYRGNRDSLVVTDGEVSGITVNIISGQHRLAALMKLEDTSQKWWPTILYDQAIEKDPRINLTTFVLSLNWGVGTVKQKTTTPLDWFRCLCDCKSQAERGNVYHHLNAEMKKYFEPLFAERVEEVAMFRKFDQLHPGFMSNLAFSNLKERRSHHLPLLDVAYLENVFEFWGGVEEDQSVYRKIDGAQSTRLSDLLMKSGTLVQVKDFITNGPTSSPSLAYEDGRATWPFQHVRVPVAAHYTGKQRTFQNAAGARNIAMQITLEKHFSAYLPAEKIAQKFHRGIETADDRKFQIQCFLVATDQSSDLSQWLKTLGALSTSPIDRILESLRELARAEEHFLQFLGACPHPIVVAFHRSLIEVPPQTSSHLSVASSSSAPSLETPSLQPVPSRQNSCNGVGSPAGGEVEPSFPVGNLSAPSIPSVVDRSQGASSEVPAATSVDENNTASDGGMPGDNVLRGRSSMDSLIDSFLNNSNGGMPNEPSSGAASQTGGGGEINLPPIASDHIDQVIIDGIDPLLLNLPYHGLTASQRPTGTYIGVATVNSTGNIATTGDSNATPVAASQTGGGGEINLPPIASDHIDQVIIDGIDPLLLNLPYHGLTASQRPTGTYIGVATVDSTGNIATTGDSNAMPVPDSDLSQEVIIPVLPTREPGSSHQLRSRSSMNHSGQKSGDQDVSAPNESEEDTESSENGSEYGARPTRKKTSKREAKRATDQPTQTAHGSSEAPSPGSLLNAGAQYEDAVDEYEPQTNASALIASMEGPVQATILQFLQRLYLVHPSLQYALMEDMLAALTLWRSSSSDLDSSAILEGEDDPISGMRKRKRVSSPKPTRPTKRIKGVTAGEGPPEDSEDESSSQPPIADEVWETMFEDMNSRPEIVYVIGAGVSVAAGLPLYRDANGRRTVKAQQAFNGELFHRRDKDTVRSLWEFAGAVLAIRQQPRPLFHRVLSRLERVRRLTAVVTTNVDGLETDPHNPEFLPEGKVLRLHGVVYEVKCTGHSVPLTVEMASALALDQPVDPPPCPQCPDKEAKKKNGREHLSRDSATYKPLVPAMTFFDHVGDTELGDAQQALFDKVFNPTPHLGLFFIIGSSLRNACLKKALLKVQRSAKIYIVDPLHNTNHREFTEAVTICTTAEEWATRVGVYLSRQSTKTLTV